MQTLGAHHIGSEALNQRRQSHGAMTDLVCKGRKAELDAFAGIALRLPVEGLVLAILLKQDILSLTWQITVHCRGTTSRVSVTSSPRFDRRAPPQHGQDVGVGCRMRSRGRCSGNGLATRLLPGEGGNLCGFSRRHLREEVVF
jgi:hypothetical protein